MSDFRNIAPVGRDARRATQSRETQEKARLAARKEGYQRYEDIGVPTIPAAETPLYLPDADRFQTDAAFEEKQRRLEEQRRYAEKLQHLRDSQVRRDEERWSAMDDRARRERERLDSLLGTDKKNVSSVAYDPLTLQYKDSPAADQLRYEDDMVRFRAEQRKVALASHQHSTAFNPLNGEPLREVTTGPKPQPPAPATAGSQRR